MLKYVNHDIVFQEFPDEVTLAINLSCCPNGCTGCHSAYLRGDVGEELTLQRLEALIKSYAGEITCVALMGGDNDPQTVASHLQYVRQHFDRRYKTGWYSGRTQLPESAVLQSAFNYVKLGPYRPQCGPLSSPDTNQRFYKVLPDGSLDDLTFRFQKRR